MLGSKPSIALVSSAWFLALAGGCDNGAAAPSVSGVNSPPAVVTDTKAAANADLAGAAGSASAVTGVPSSPANAANPSGVGPRGESAATPLPAAKPAQADPKVVTSTTLPVGPGAAPNAADPVIAKRIIPIDDRATTQALGARPISGGTLIATKDNQQAVAADPERDRVTIIDLMWNVATDVALLAGDEPGRLAQDDAGRVHVVLRGAGAVASIDLATKKLVARRAVCAAPRGIGFDAASKSLKIACVGGEMVTLPAASGDVTQRVVVAPDLRDVLSTSTGTFVTRLKSAELLGLDASGKPTTTSRAAEDTQLVAQSDGSQLVDAVSPVAARRTVASANGGMIMLHQGARNGDIEVKPLVEDVTVKEQSFGGSPYGGSGGGCDGVVTTQITRFDGGGKVVSTSRIPGVLVVDVAESSKTGEIAVAIAGPMDPMQPVVQVVPTDANGMAIDGALQPTPVASVEGEPLVMSVMMFTPETMIPIPQTKGGGVTCSGPSNAVALPSPATAVAYAGDRLLVQTREPARVFVVTVDPNVGLSTTPIELGGAKLLDTGHEVFHRDAGAGVACASCHVEGGDDGHVWHFSDQGARRTQSMLIGLEGTAPFHWVGDMNNLNKLMETVFVGRMGGVHQSTARMGALEKWMYAIKAPPALRAANDPAAQRGRALFEGEAECSKCHTGPKFTNNETVDVGTGVALQVPSLIAVGFRGPWIHTGCAATLRDRFNPACGGDKHGKVAQLADAQVDDVVAYLESL